MRMNKLVSQNMSKRVQRLLDEGHFPEVGWQRRPVYNYNTDEYLKVWGRMAHLVDQALKEHGYLLGCYELRRSNQFRQEVMQIIGAVTPEAIEQCHLMCGVPGLC